ncbi:hypothetical protein, partial [Nitrosospira sp. Nsp18]|uniref:hypothetical protein n=1 Tax=Nitrosospira sp. Nsp18 TaxID=1855334 RepID=UPI001C40991B
HIKVSFSVTFNMAQRYFSEYLSVTFNSAQFAAPKAGGFCLPGGKSADVCNLSRINLCGFAKRI